MPASLTESIEREVRLETSPERAFAFWLDPALLTRWMGDRAEIDPRPGGRWRLEYGDGPRFVAAGEFLEIDRPRRLVLTWGWEKGEEGAIPPGASRVEVTFEPDGDATRMRLRHSDLPERERPGHAEGWDYFLPRLEAASVAGPDAARTMPPGGSSMGDPATDRTAGAGPSPASGGRTTSVAGGEARAVADVPNGLLLATAWLPASPERVFRALASDEITRWWVRPGVFDTREWQADVRTGGRWRASGIGGGRPYTLEGEFVEVDRPRRLVHTWAPVGASAAPSTATYVLDPLAGGTWLTLRQEGFAAREPLLATTIGWETSFARLAEILAEEAGSTGPRGDD